MSVPLVLTPFLFVFTLSPVPANEVVVLDWNRTWDYMQPMGLDPAIADPDFDATWSLKALDFAANYDGPAFGGAPVAGNAANPASFDRGSGAGPLGYGTINYFSAPAAVVTAFGTTLTTPASGNRYSSYFRTTFTTGQIYTSPRIRMVLDDGALIYLDGALVARVNKGGDTEGYTQLATDLTATLNETGGSLVDEECVQSFPLAVAGAGTQADSFVVVAVPTLTAGEHTLAVSARSDSPDSSDMCMALQLLANDAGISAVASNVQRQSNGPGFADDTFSFDVTVTATNLPGAVSWSSNNPAANGPTTGSYPAVYSYSNYPAQVDIGTLARAAITFTDDDDPLLTTSITVTAPEGPPGPTLVISAATPAHGTGFEEAGMGLGNFSRRDFHSELGFTSNGVVVHDGLASAAGSKMLSFSNVNALMTTEAVGIDPAVKGVQAGVTLRTYTNTDSGFEFDDSLRIHVEGSPDGVVWTDMGSVVPALSGNDPANPLNPAGVDQILVKLGPGTPGLPVLRSRTGWSARGHDTGTPANDTLTLPRAFVAAGAEPVQMEFTHRYSFELTGRIRWDGGAVTVAVNGGPFTYVPGTAFSQHGYDAVVTGNHALNSTEAFSGDSPNYSTGGMVTSILTIPGLAPGDSFQVQFFGAWDESTTGSNPNWEINDIEVKSGATVLYSENFASGDGGLTATAGWIFDNGTANPGPAYYSFTRFALPVAPGDQFVRMRLYQPTSGPPTPSEFILIDHIKLEAGLDPLADADGDGLSNGLEDLAGTSPTDPLSAFRVSTIVGPSPDTPGSQRATFSFPAADFRTYKFQSSADLLTWNDIDVRYGDPATLSLTLAGEAATPENFWRLSVVY